MEARRQERDDGVAVSRGRVFLGMIDNPTPPRSFELHQRPMEPLMNHSEPFVSTLPTEPMRFLAEATEHALRIGRRTPGDFIRHFPPTAIMTALDAVPALRANLLTVLVGVRERTALKTPSADAGRLLEAALQEGDCDALAIVDTFGPEDRIRYLDSKRMWSFLMEGEFWNASRAKDSANHKLAQAHIAYLIEHGLLHGLRTKRDVVDGISVEVLAEKLPRSELAKALKRALQMGREGQAFTDADLYAAVPPTVLVDHVALPVIMQSVIVPMGESAKFVERAPDYGGFDPELEADGAVMAAGNRT
jgi:hypothetical protein